MFPMLETKENLHHLLVEEVVKSLKDFHVYLPLMSSKFKMTVSVSEPTFSISRTYKIEKAGSLTETVILNLRWNSSIVDILENPLDFLPMNLLLWLTTKTEFIFIMSGMCLQLIVEVPSNFSLNPMDRLFLGKKYID
jgi:hypothetical protein